jgi:hypothetical protein
VVRGISRDAKTLRAMGEAARASAPEYERGGELRKLVAIIEGAAQQ